MKKAPRRLPLHRETILTLAPSVLAGIAAGDNEAPYTRTLLPNTESWECPQSVTCDSVVIC